MTDNTKIKESNFCSLDYETYSEQDIKTGSFRYAQDQSTEVICLAYKFNHQKETLLWYPDLEIPKDLVEHIKSGGLIRAWNATFEYAITNYTMHRLYNFPKVKYSQMRCTQTDALTLALPASLDACGKVLGLDILKDKTGKMLINKLSKPRKATRNKPYTRITKDIEPEFFEQFYSYCKKDVDAEVAIYNALPRHLSKKEQEIYELTLKINERGVNIDNELVNAIIRDKNNYEMMLNQEVKEISGLLSTNSRPQSLTWLKDNGLELKGYTKKDIKDALKRDDINKNVKRFLEIRSEMSRTPIKKYDFIKKAICKDNTIKNNLIMNKATTGRYSSTGLQLQNLPRDASDNPEKLITLFKSGASIKLDRSLENRNIFNEAIQLIRNVIVAPKDCKLVVSDFSSIENRVLAWLANDKQTLDDFIKGVDQYKKTASQIFNVKYEEVTKQQRQLGKIAVLSCGYGAGFKSFYKVCTEGWGVDITLEEAEEIVYSYRESNPKILKMWYGLMDAAIEAATSNNVTFYKNIKFRKMNDYLFMRLPSGKLLAYYKPKMEWRMPPWGKEKLVLTHLGTNTYTRKWERVNLIPNRLTENAVQGTSAEILKFAMINTEKKCFKIVACVHDEIIAYVEKNSGLGINDLNAIMCVSPDWCKDLPLNAEGFEGDFYHK